MLGEELRKARHAAKMTQEALAFAAKVDRSYISELEHNLKSPTVDMLLRLCRAMGVSAGKIITRLEKRSRRGA
jgi:transcriptional regulator with XRE-family HTH domain